MSAEGHFEDEDFALYAMHLLTEPEAAAVARALAENENAKQRLAEVRATIGVYAQTSVDLDTVPQGGLIRLMKTIEQEKKLTPFPMPASRKTELPAVKRETGTAKFLPWIGWPVAAALAISTGILYQDRAALERHRSGEMMAMHRDRDALQANIAAQSQELARLQTEAANARSAAVGLRKTVTGQTAILNEQKGSAATTARERDVLRGTVAAQANQVAQLTSDQQTAERIFEALEDPTALRVTLKKPTSKAVPTGRATYIASKGTLIFFGSNLGPLKPNKVYELWLMPADGSNPIPTGTFAPDSQGNANLLYPHFAHSVTAKGFSVTIENAGGSLTPTLPIVLAGL